MDVKYTHTDIAFIFPKALIINTITINETWKKNKLKQTHKYVFS